MPSHKLFQPFKLGSVTLQHRIVLAPLTRLRANDKREHEEIAVEYYTQRASAPGTLIIAEGTMPAPGLGGWKHAPGIWSDGQIAAWKKITDAVHEKDSYIYLQLWAPGRAAVREVLADEGGELISADSIPLGDGPKPRPLSIPEIKQYVRDFATAASNAVHRAGFDGVEVHAANGYLIDQFIQTNSNSRADEYGGSIENRIRFPLEIVAAVSDAVGQERTGFRLSPWSTFQDMRMLDPIPTFSALVNELKSRFGRLAFLHAIEPRVIGNDTSSDGLDTDSNDFIEKLWNPRPLILSGNFVRESAITAAEKGNILVAMGRYFISNPDLPQRFKNGWKLSPYDRNTFYTNDAVGYTDYPFYDSAL